MRSNRYIHTSKLVMLALVMCTGITGWLMPLHAQAQGAAAPQQGQEDQESEEAALQPDSEEEAQESGDLTAELEEDPGEGEPDRENATSASSGILEEWNESWLLLLWVFFFGSVGGLVSELLTLRGRIEWFHRTKAEEVTDELEGAVAGFLFDLGVFARLFIGGAAALLVLWLLELEEDGGTAVIAGSILAGAAGGAVFRTLRARLEAALAAKELAQTRSLATELAGTVEELAASQESLKEKLSRGSESPMGVKALTFSTSTELELPELERMDKLLGEARALSRAAAVSGRVPSRVGVLEVLSEWSGVPFAQVGPDGKKIADLWLQNSGNPQLHDGHLGNLIQRLEARFPRAGLRLRPDDLKPSGGVPTVGQLVGHVELRAPGGRG